MKISFSCQFGPNGKMVASCFCSKSGTHLWIGALDDSSQRVALIQERNRFGTTGDGSFLGKGELYDTPATILSISPDSRLLALVVAQEVQVWNLESGTRVGRFPHSSLQKREPWAPTYRVDAALRGARAS